MDDALEPRLGDCGGAGVLQVLAKQHAETRCGHGAWLVGFRQVDHGEGGVRRQQQAVLTAIIFDGEQQLVAFWLGDLVDASA